VGVPPAQAAQALGSFENVKRRMELRGCIAREAGSITVYDDFAHHPSAIRTTLEGLRRQVGPTVRILAVFEPRSNTMKLGAMKALLPWCLADANLAFCHVGGLDWDAREALASMGDRALVSDDIEALLAQLIKAARPGDHIHQKLLRSL
jgi:UDP-N-acetylmuramate: L-alanyl-gamma-D-glutamyl-meso-diaminopimelate ligase